MLIRITRCINFKNLARSSSILFRNSHSQGAVALAFNEYEKSANATAAPFIVMHGLFGSKSNWNSLCKAFAAKTSPPRKIYSVDSRNHGLSPHTEDHSYPLMAADVAKFLTDRSIEKASILGHSMGGRAMMYFALKYPHLVERLIVVDISPISPIGTSRTDIPLFISAMKAIRVPNNYTIHQGRKVADERLSEIIDDLSLRNFLITNLAKSDSGEFVWRINLETLEKDFEEEVANFPVEDGMRYDGPTLFIGGSKSDYLRPSDKPGIDKFFPNSQLVYLDAGHWVHAEKPEDFVKLVINFLNQN